MKLIIGGDVSISKDCADIFASQDEKTAFGNVTDVFKTADRVIVNLECAVTDKNTPIKKFGPNLCAPFGTVETLKKAGVTDCAISNNHIFDFGRAGLEDTVKSLEKNGMGYTGIGENNIDARRDMIITDGKTKIAVIAVCEHEFSYALPDRVGCREYDPYDTTEDIINAKKNADYVVVIYHGGKEDCRYPSPRLLKLCRSMVKCGADAVLCQHSHCIGCYENFEGGHILYGQGNFHFIYSEDTETDPEKWDNGLLISLDFTQDGIKTEFIPTVMGKKGVRLADFAEKEKILNGLFERSRSLSDGTWRDGWHKFCVENKEAYSNHLKEGAEDLFGHYLDCESHTDVLRELFQTWNMTNEKD